MKSVFNILNKYIELGKKRNEICVERVQQPSNHINSIRTSPYIGLTEQDFNDTSNPSNDSPKLRFSYDMNPRSVDLRKAKNGVIKPY